MGSIRKRGTNRWEITYELPRGPDGERRRRFETVRGPKKMAQARLTKAEHEINQGQYLEPTKLTVAEYLDIWTRDYAQISVRPRTLQGYQHIIETHIKRTFGPMRLIDLNTHDVQTYYADCIRSGLSAQTVMHIHRLLSQTLKQAVRWKMLYHNVLDGITPPPRRKPELRSLSPEEARALLQGAEKTDYHLPIHLAIFTGLRRSEILGLRWRDIDIENHRLTVARTMVDMIGDATHINEPSLVARCARSQSAKTPPQYCAPIANFAPSSFAL